MKILLILILVGVIQVSAHNVRNRNIGFPVSVKENGTFYDVVSIDRKTTEFMFF